MKYLYILSFFLSFDVFGMEMPFGPHRESIKAAIARIEKGDPREKKEGFRKLLQLSLEDDEAKYSLACTCEYGV